jgi:hypothetical protein
MQAGDLQALILFNRTGAVHRRFVFNGELFQHRSWEDLGCFRKIREDHGAGRLTSSDKTEYMNIVSRDDLQLGAGEGLILFA